MPQSILRKLWLFKDSHKTHSLSEFKRLSKDIEKIDKSRNRFHIFMIVKLKCTDSGDSMVIKTDEIKAEMVNYTKRNMTITLSLNSNSKPSPQSNNYLMWIHFHVD